MEFYRIEPTARSSWRLAILMGANSRTYKFALGSSLLKAAAEGRAEITLAELAVPYTMELVRRLGEAPQAPARSGGTLGDADFLTVAAREAEESLRIGRPTEELSLAAVRSMPAMVMRKFHNLRGGVELPHRFYEVDRGGVVRLTPALREIALTEQAPTLSHELDARWSIVQTSFAAGVGQSLIRDGVDVDLETLRITDKQRRRSVAGVTEAVVGFQHGRCLTCWEPLIPGVDEVAVDHVFPYSFNRLLGTKTDLDAIWNLAPAHASCNGQKSNRPPSQDEMSRLAGRNEAIMGSPHPLSKTLRLTLKRYRYSETRPGEWLRFVRDLYASL